VQVCEGLSLLIDQVIALFRSVFSGRRVSRHAGGILSRAQSVTGGAAGWGA